jgi:ABC-type multidrug transport system fused ATPase/permease subunit
MVTSTQDMRAMLDLLNRPPKLIDAPNAAPLAFNDGTIEFRNASFRYGEKTILNDVSLTIPGGAFVAFVGPSGVGKTTLFRLLFRFINLDQGQLLIDGQPVDAVTMDSVRQRIGVIPQDTVMFNDTVRYNVRYGKLDATDEEVEVAANRAKVHEAIARFDEGYDTNVGERGLKLSGGEKQRVAIARCLLQNPEIILADEATSALDTATEADVVKTLRGVDGHRDRKRTVVMIAHRLTTVRHCDCIFVLGHNGQIAERGTHEELLLRPNGLYASLWNQQRQERQV